MKKINLEVRIKQAMVLRNMSLEELSAKIGMTRQNLMKRMGIGSIETKHLEKIAEVLNLDVSYFVSSNNTNRLEECERLLVKLNEENHLLKESLKDKQKIINLLERK
jgi:DNA-binding Xre family transcriptional regulator